jgi:hypothetical protein
MKIRLITVAALVVIAGCATAPATVQTIDTLDFGGEKPRVLLMPPDVRYYLLTAGGTSEPHEEWTTAAQTNFRNEVLAFAASRDSDVIEVDRDSLTDDEIEYETLHSAVGLSLLIHHYGTLKLPSKNGAFDWSLGPGVSSLADRYDADYALFSYYRDYQASGGRVAFAILAAAAGVGVATGSESGFASLVDLRSGDIVWFNRVIMGSGELRDEEGARKTVANLLGTLPQPKSAAAPEPDGATDE